MISSPTDPFHMFVLKAVGFSAIFSSNVFLVNVADEDDAPCWAVAGVNLDVEAVLLLLSRGGVEPC